jgi:hypothetical protein
MTPRPFVLHGESALRALRERCAAAATRWSADWGVTLDERSIACSACDGESPAGAAPWRSWRPAGAAVAWIADGDCEEAVAWAIAGGEGLPRGPMRVTPLVAQAAAEALADLVGALVQALRGKPGMPASLEPGQIAADVLAPGSGAVAVFLQLGPAVLGIVVPHRELALPASPRSARPPAIDVTPVVAAVQGTSVVVRAEMGTVEVAVAEVRDLAPGDVIRLGRRLADPVELVGPDGAALCRGHLGAYEGCRALDLVP